jgi:hypothetical protein
MSIVLKRNVPIAAMTLLSLLVTVAHGQLSRDVKRSRVAVIADDPADLTNRYVTAALDPGRRGLDGITANALRPSDVTADNAKDYDQFWLVDVATPNEKLAVLLRKRINEGAGLCVFLGPRADAKLYQRHFFPMGRELLPALPGRLVELKFVEANPRIQFTDADRRLAEVFRGGDRRLLERVQLLKYRHVERDPTPAQEEPFTILAKAGDAPLILERKVGRGRVVAVYTSPDEECTNWPIEISWVVVVQELHARLAQPDEPRDESQKPKRAD